MNQKLRAEDPIVPETAAGLSVFHSNSGQSMRPRVLVLGDTGVGKSSLLRVLCHHRDAMMPLRPETYRFLPPQRKIPQVKDFSTWQPRELGCEIHVANHAGRSIEFWELNGDRSHLGVRSIFYDNFDALFLVYDVSNLKSYHNLLHWLYELFTRQLPPSTAYFMEILDVKSFDAEDPPRTYYW